MKKFYILISFLVFSVSGYCQETWGPPFPLTDSLTNNVNATLSIVPGEMIQPDTLYLLWERSTDTSATEIYARNLTVMGQPFVVASHPNAHFLHPRVFRRGSGDTLFLFTYETDMNGTWDIYYSALMKDESVQGPFPFIRSSLNERSLNFGDSQSFAWEKEGTIYARNPVTDTVTLSSDSCMNPVTDGQEYVAFEMYTGPNIGIFYNHYSFITQNWSQVYPVDIYGTNTHVTMGNDSYGVNFNQNIFWQHKDGPYWLIKGFDPGNIQYLSFNNFPACNNVSPSVINVYLITKKIAAPIIFATFASDVTGNMEIYINNLIADTNYSNLSNYTGIDAHPQLFNNLHHYGMGLDNQIFNIWESFRGGHWQLWASNLDILTGIDTQSAGGLKSIRATPNPSVEFTFIEYTTPDSGEIPIDIYDLSGKKVITLISHTSYIIATKVNVARWDGLIDSGSRVPPGIYFAAPGNDSRAPRCKIIRQ